MSPVLKKNLGSLVKVGMVFVAGIAVAHGWLTKMPDADQIDRIVSGIVEVLLVVGPMLASFRSNHRAEKAVDIARALPEGVPREAVKAVLDGKATIAEVRAEASAPQSTGGLDPLNKEIDEPN